MEKRIPIVSIIIPCFNSGNTIEKTLESLAEQSFKNFEVLIINDGSTDDTEMKILEFVNNNTLNIKYFLQPNQGVSSARNFGLKNARGKYIAFLDSDDLYRSEFLKILVESIEYNECDTSYCCFTRNLEIEKQDNDDRRTTIYNHNDLMNNFMYNKGPTVFPSFLYKKAILDENNINFNINLEYGEDIEFIWRYLSECENGVFINQPLYIYVDNPLSAINNANWRMTDGIIAIKEIEKILEKKQDSFKNEFSPYMINRTIWAVAKDFALSGDKKLFLNLLTEYDVSRAMKDMRCRGNHFLIRLSSIVYKISPKLFYYLILSSNKLNL